jgi:hypothetical protein
LRDAVKLRCIVDEKKNKRVDERINKRKKEIEREKREREREITVVVL